MTRYPTRFMGNPIKETAKELQMSYKTLLDKLHGKHPFKIYEISHLMRVYKLNFEECENELERIRREVKNGKKIILDNDGAMVKK